MKKLIHSVQLNEEVTFLTGEGDGLRFFKVLSCGDSSRSISLRLSFLASRLAISGTGLSD